MLHLFSAFGKGGYSLKHKITPVSNVAYVLYIWKGWYSL